MASDATYSSPHVQRSPTLSSRSSMHPRSRRNSAIYKARRDSAPPEPSVSPSLTETPPAADYEGSSYLDTRFNQGAFTFPPANGGVGLGIGVESSSDPNALHSVPRPPSFAGSAASLSSAITTSVPSYSVPSHSSHGRQSSLTSACPPALSHKPLQEQSAAVKMWNGARSAFPFAGAGAGGLSPRAGVSRPSDERRSWGWMPSSHTKPSPSNETSADDPDEHSHSPRRTKHRASRPTVHPFVRMLLGPFAQLLLPETVQPDLLSKKRSPLLWRLLSASYIIFAVIYLTTQLLSGASNSVWASSYLPSDSAQWMWDSWSSPSTGPLIGRPYSDGVASHSPTSRMSHISRFGKLFSKVPFAIGDDIEPYAFVGTGKNHSGAVTACLYTNEAWISELPEFVRRWQGPVSLVFEDPNPRLSKERSAVVSRLGNLRSSNTLVRQLVDFHIVSSLPTTDLDRQRERLVINPKAKNFHLNLARFFSRSEMVWMVGDPRVYPSAHLRRRLNDPQIHQVVLGHGDAVVVPTFAMIRGAESARSLSIDNIKSDQDYDAWGLSNEVFSSIAASHLERHKTTLPISMDKWPRSKKDLIERVASVSSAAGGAEDVSTDVGTVKHGGVRDGVFGLYDYSFPLNQGPTNWELWKKGKDDHSLSSPPADGGGRGLGLDKGIGGGGVGPFVIKDMPMDYSPNFVMSRDVQPWCTERFESNKAACAYQVFMAGAEFWVIHDEWAFTLEPVEKYINERSEIEKQRSSIDKRLYTKFHQEVCMHYGRQLISQGHWEGERSNHVKRLCRRLLQQWNVGLISG